MDKETLKWNATIILILAAILIVPLGSMYLWSLSRTTDLVETVVVENIYKEWENKPSMGKGYHYYIKSNSTITDDWIHLGYASTGQKVPTIGAIVRIQWHLRVDNNNIVGWLVLT